MANNIFTTDGYGRDCSLGFHATRGEFCHPIFDTRISYTARAILLYMHHHPGLLSFNFAELSAYREPHHDPEIGVRRAMKELEAYGYIIKNARGRFVIPRIVRDLIDAVSKTKKGRR